MNELLRGPVSDWMYSGAFGDVGTLVGKAGPRSGEKRNHIAEQTDRLVANLLDEINRIESVISAAALQDLPAPVIKYDKKWPPGLGPNDSPHLQAYARNYREILKMVDRTLKPILESEVEGAMILTADMQVLASLRRTMLLDMAIFSSLRAEARSKRADRYDGNTIREYDTITYGLDDTIITEHERAFSKSGLSNADVGAAWLFGATDVHPEKDVMDDDSNPVEIEVDFNDPAGLFAELDVNPMEINGMSSRDIHAILRKAYYGIMKKIHPDVRAAKSTDGRNAALHDKIVKIREAYDILNDPAKRDHYLKTGAVVK